ncbi:MAG: cytochrome C [Rhodothermales bacterium]|nr:cytochrome C [Rhodothermales bacterium]
MNLILKYAAATMLPILVVFYTTGCIDSVPPDESEEMATEFIGDPVDNGEISYALYCTSCHGEQGYGDGPVASALTVKPTDLTKLTQKYDGIFPAEEIYAYVDGRRDVAAHGTRDMPVWGQVWQEEGSKQSDEEVDTRLRELVEYIRSLQE